MRPPPRLSNCYTPLPLPKNVAPKDRKARVLARRGDRSPHTLRPLRLESNVISSASGSALVELGNTKVLCTVTGPVTTACPQIPSSLQLKMDEGILYVDVKYTPATGYREDKVEAVSSIDPNQQQQHNKLHSFMLNRESDLSARVLSALQAAVPLRPYPKCAIAIQLTVLQDDGSILPACVTAASLALTQAGIEVYDLVTACSVAVILQTGGSTSDATATAVVLLADPTLEEMSVADCVVSLAILPNWKEATVWEQSGAADLSQTVTNEAVNLCRDGCRTMHKLLREHLLLEHEAEQCESPSEAMHDTTH
jgi:exosome complex component MTR3